MRSLRALFLRLAGLIRKDRRARELSAELESHLQMHIEDNVRAGMSTAEARREALMKLGGMEQTKENYRDRQGIPLLETLWQDLRFAARTLGKNPGFPSIAASPLALATGATTPTLRGTIGVRLSRLPSKIPKRPESRGEGKRV